MRCKQLKLAAWRRNLTTAPKYQSYILEDDLSVTHARRLETTFSPYFPTTPHLPSLQKGSPVPSGYHLIYFNHCVAESMLDTDGYDNLQAPLTNGVPLLRRWLKGSLTFNSSRPLKLGEDAICIEKVINFTQENSKSRFSVTIERYMKHKNSAEPSISEFRTLYYFQPTRSLLKGMEKLVSGKPLNDELLSYCSVVTHEIHPSKMLLFRYSALSFNAHLIHYDTYYAREVESLPGPIAQGPLLISLVLKWFSSFVQPQMFVKKMEYENLGSILIDDRVRLNVCPIVDKEWKVWVTRHTEDNKAERLVFVATILVS